MREKIGWDKYTYGNMIKAHCRFGELQKAYELLLEMISCSIRPSIIEIDTLIHGCARSEKMQYANRIIQIAQENSIDLSNRTYVSLISGYGKVNDFKEVMKIYTNLTANGFIPDDFVFSSMVVQASNHDNLEVIEFVRSEAKKYDVELGEVSLNAIAGNYAMNGKFNEFQQIIKEIKQRGLNVTLRALNPLLSYHVKNGDFKKAKSILLHLKKEYSCSPDVSSFNQVLRGFVPSGNVELILDLFDDMRESFSITPNTITVIHLLNTICNSGDTGEIFLMNCTAVFELVKSLKLYMPSSSVSIVISKLIGMKCEIVDKIKLIFDLIDYLCSYCTTITSHHLCKFVPFVNEFGSANDKIKVKDLMDHWNITKENLEATGSIQNEIFSKTNPSDLEAYALFALNNSNINDAQFAVGMVRKHGKEISTELLTELFHEVSNTSDTEEAQTLFSLLKENGVKPTYEMFGRLYNQRKNN